MSSGWNIDVYRTRAKKWREEANRLHGGNEREAYLVIADGYAHLVALIENDIRFADSHAP